MDLKEVEELADAAGQIIKALLKAYLLREDVEEKGEDDDVEEESNPE